MIFETSLFKYINRNKTLIMSQKITYTQLKNERYYIKMEKFWLKEPSNLINNYWVLIPNNNMTLIEKLNTITRTLIYFIILIILFNKDKIFIVYALLFILLILVFYFIYSSAMMPFVRVYF